MERWLLVVLAGCGRIAFDPLGSGDGNNDGGGDLGDGGVGTGDLLAYYKLDDIPSDGVLDSSGHGHHGACAGACPGVGSTAQVGTGSYDFNSGTYLAIPDAPDLHPIELTATCWINVRSLGLQNYVGKPFGNEGSNSWEIYMEASGAIRGCSASGSCAGSSSAVTTNVWHHLAYVATASLQTIYIDGIQQGTSTSTLVWDASDILIGADRSGGAALDFADGRIDDVRIYGRALSAPEISALAAP